MSIDGEMILVTALIRPYMEEHVVQSLHNLPEFPSFTFTAVRGQGGSYVSSDTDLTYHQFLELRLVCRYVLAGEICESHRVGRLDRQKGRRCRVHDAGPHVRAHQGHRPASGETR